MALTKFYHFNLEIHLEHWNKNFLLFIVIRFHKSLLKIRFFQQSIAVTRISANLGAAFPDDRKVEKFTNPPRNFAPRNPLRHSDRVPFPLGGTIFTLAPASSFYLFR